MTTAPRARIDFAPVRIAREDRPDGSFILRSATPLGAYADNICQFLVKWAGEAPDRVFLAERGGDGAWITVTYVEALAKVRSIAQSLIDRGINAAHPVMILSDNGIENGLLQLGAMFAGVPAAPVSPAYSLLSTDGAKLRHIFDLLEPKLVFAADGTMFGKALARLDLDGVEVVCVRNPADGIASTAFSDLIATTPTAAVDAALATVGPDTVAKILFTSGSTDLPKGVVNTHRMLCSNQQAIAQVWPFVEARPPVIVDWLPWNHTFGGNHNFNLILRNGGTLYIDAGKPVPHLIEKTVANLKDVAPTLYFNVPRGFDMLIPHLERDEALRATFFSRLDTVFYAGAALPQTLWERLEALSVQATGAIVNMTSSWGATETAPMVTSVHFPIDEAGNIGVPAPGCELKMIPNAGKLEMRVWGPNVTPGYYKRDDLTRTAFDEDGFYIIGDAGRLADPDDPNRGIAFDGRIAEDFKLSTGTWVHAGNLRVAALGAGAPVIQDAVITGHDRDEVGLLVFPSLAACAGLAGLDASAPAADIVAHEAVRAALARGLAAHNARHPGSSERITRALIMTAPPSIDANEITDKGYINQRAVMEARADLVDLLYGDGPAVIRPEERDT
jgi:feruloyl-CoA synthase